MDAERMVMYHDAVEDLASVDIINGARAIIRSEKFFPVPAEMRRYAEQARRDRIAAERSERPMIAAPPSAPAISWEEAVVEEVLKSIPTALVDKWLDIFMRRAYRGHGTAIANEHAARRAKARETIRAAFIAEGIIDATPESEETDDNDE